MKHYVVADPACFRWTAGQEGKIPALSSRINRHFLPDILFGSDQSSFLVAPMGCLVMSTACNVGHYPEEQPILGLNYFIVMQKFSTCT